MENKVRHSRAIIWLKFGVSYKLFYFILVSFIDWNVCYEKCITQAISMTFSISKSLIHDLILVKPQACNQTDICNSIKCAFSNSSVVDSVSINDISACSRSGYL